MPELTVMAATVAAAVICVLTHYQAFTLLTGVMGRHRIRRRGLIVVMLGLLAVHCVEIGVFAGLYVWLESYCAYGAVVYHETGVPLVSLLEYYYFSSTVYTTLGFGDLVPHGLLRLVAGIEALAGFSLITWSASFTFLEMQQFWAADAP